LEKYYFTFCPNRPFTERSFKFVGMNISRANFRR
jgi:hypothetical protein